MKDFRLDFLPYIATEDGQINNLTFTFRRYRGKSKNDHAHCELCWITIGQASVSNCEEDGYYCEETGSWICPKCFFDFSTRYNWGVVNGGFTED